jgi:PAS domain-containing protein
MMKRYVRKESFMQLTTGIIGLGVGGVGQSIVSSDESISCSISSCESSSSSSDHGRNVRRGSFDAMAVLNAEGHLVETDPEFRNSFGYSDDDVYGKNFVRLLTGAVTDPLKVQGLEDAVFDNSDYEQEISLYGKNDCHRCKLSLTPRSSMDTEDAEGNYLVAHIDFL